VAMPARRRRWGVLQTRRRRGVALTIDRDRAQDCVRMGRPLAPRHTLMGTRAERDVVLDSTCPAEHTVRTSFNGAFGRVSAFRALRCCVQDDLRINVPIC